MITDMKMREFKVGQKVIKAELKGNSPILTFRTVEAIEGDDLYLDGAYKRGQKVRFPNRLLIIFT